VIGIVSISSQLLKTVGLLAVRLDLTKLQLKKRKKKFAFLTKIESPFFTKILTIFFAIKTQFFGCQNKNNSQNEECHISLSSLLNFQSIDYQTWTFFIFFIVCKNRWCTPLQKMEELVKKLISLKVIGIVSKLS